MITYSLPVGSSGCCKTLSVSNATGEFNGSVGRVREGRHAIMFVSRERDLVMQILEIKIGLILGIILVCHPPSRVNCITKVIPYINHQIIYEDPLFPITSIQVTSMGV